MRWIDRAFPPEREDPPPVKPAAPPNPAIVDLADERATLAAKVRRGIRSRHQERILRRIAEITREMLGERRKP
jgi:hypothetical protein